MKQIVASILREFWRIGVGFFRGIWNELLFPGRKEDPEDKLLGKIKGQHGMIRSLQEQLSVQAGEMDDKEREIARLNSLLDEKTKECEDLKKVISSLELGIQEEISRHKRKR